MTAIGWPLIENRIREGKVSNTFGRFKARTSGVHWGWDFYAPVGTPCFAIADGLIVDVYGDQNDTGGFGLVSVLEFNHAGRKLYAAYCHLAGIKAAKGTEVIRGEAIGLTGNSGNAVGMRGDDQHLHFELRTSLQRAKGGPPLRIDPITVFKKCPLTTSIIEP